MNRRLTRILLSGALAVAASVSLASSASASFHLNLIREVHYSGTDGDYVVIQSYATGQNFLTGAKIVTYDGAGFPFGTQIVLSQVANGANNATVLAGGPTVSGADAGAAGFTIVNNGSVCLLSATNVGLDCVSFGLSPTNPLPSPAGTPVALPGGALSAGQSILRSISRGCPTLLDPADDTNNSATDFALGTPNPRNNASPITETPCPTTTHKKKCKKKKHRSAESAKKKKCKKKKKG